MSNTKSRHYRFKFKRLSVIIGCSLGLITLWSIGYFMAANGIVVIYSGGVLENSFWNAFLLTIFAGIVFLVIGFFMLIVRWICPANKKMISRLVILRGLFLSNNNLWRSLLK